jgi:hypothetical protein
MTGPGYLSRLVLRSTRPDTGLRPRPSAVYEPPTAEPLVRRSPDDRPGPGTPAEQDVSRALDPNEHAVSGSSMPELVERDDFAAPEKDAAIAWRLPTTRQASSGTRHGPTGDLPSEPQVPEVRVQAKRDGSVSVRRAMAAPGSLARAVEAGSVANRVGGEAGRTRGDVGQVVEVSQAGEVGEAGDARGDLDETRGKAVAARGEVSQRRGEASRARTDVNEARGQAGQMPTGLAWGEPVAVVPRLEVPVEVGEPDVKVTIGRIEIVRPAVAEPAPRPAPGRRTTSAPDLAEYLKSRSGR